MKQILLSIFMTLLSINVQAQCPINITEPIGDGSAYKFYLSNIAQCAAFTLTTPVYINGATNEYLVNDCGDLDGDGIIRVDLTFNSGPATVVLATDAPISISVGTTTCYYNATGYPVTPSCPQRIVDRVFNGTYFDLRLNSASECANYPLGMEIPITSSAGTGYYGIGNCASLSGVTTAQLTFSTGTPIVLSSQAPITIAGCEYDALGNLIVPCTTPTAYTLAGGAGVAISIPNSQTGVNYQLKNGTSNVGSSMPGTTGSSVSFGVQTAGGTYTVVATAVAGGCTTQMTGSVIIATPCTTPTAYPLTGGTGVAISIPNSQTGVNYQLKDGTIEVDFSKPGTTGMPLSFGVQSSGAATYTVVATTATGGCTALMTGSVVVAEVVNCPTSIATVDNGNSYDFTLFSYGECGHFPLGSTISINSTPYSIGNCDDGTGETITSLTIQGGFTAVPLTAAPIVFMVGSSRTCSYNNMGNFIPACTTPTAYTLTGGTGIAISIPNSQNNVNYQLKNGTTSVGLPFGGIAGMPVSFGVQTAVGTYTVVATTAMDDCTAQMTGSVVIANIYTGTSTCETYTYPSINGNQWFDLTTPSGIVCSINPNGENLGTLTVSVGDPAGATTVGSNTFLGRNINITSSAYPSGNIPTAYSLKLYYYDSEFNDYKTAIGSPSATLADLNVAWASGGTGCTLSDYASTATSNGSVAKANVNETEFGMSNNGFQLQFDLNHFTVFAPTISGSPNPLPIKLLGFTGYKDKSTHRLNWTTATEQNASHFEVEYSATGRDFMTIGNLRAAGNSNTPQSYDFTNKPINQSTNQPIYYYRLKMVDFDGSFEYSNIIAIQEKDNDNIVKCYPNPTENLLYIDAADRTQAVTISDEIGRTIQTHTTTPNTIDLSTFATGVYHVQVGYQHFNVVKL
jgi:hypothetical protein